MISKVAWAGYFRRSWFWPHLLLLVMFLFQVFQTDPSYETMINALSLVLSLVLVLMMFLGLNEGREELNRKTIIRLRTLPISWAEECLGSSLALTFYGLTLLAPIFFVFVVLYQSSYFDANVVKWNKFDYQEDLFESQHQFKAGDELSKNERFAIKASFYEGQLGSDKSFTILKPSQTNLKENFQLKAKRVTYFPLEQSEISIPKSVLFRGADIKIVIDEVYILEERCSLLISLLNGSLALAIHGLLLSVLFILLGRKVSIEVGVFFIIGILLISSIYSLLGNELLQEAVEKMKGRDPENTKFVRLWWQPILFEWTKIMAKFEWIKLLFEFDSTIDIWKAEKAVPFPMFQIKFLKELLIFSLMVIVGVSFLKPKET